jgi:methyl-accepting chemotaxis protein
VRSLAQRSAAAAKEIKGLIDDSVGNVATGTALVARAGTTMDEIVASITRVTDIMAEITSATSEQTMGIEQVNQAIAQMDQATQQNASLVEEAAAASETMQRQAADLAEAVRVFKLDDKPVAPVALVKRAASAPAARPVVRAAPVRQQPRLATAKAAEESWETF